MGKLYLILLLLFIPIVPGKVAMSAVNHLTDPCQFPLPSSRFFKPLCQFDYHEVSWLCDPSGLLSRTEAEILDISLRKISNISSCFCDTDACLYDSTIKVSLLLIPYGSVASIDSCVSASPFATGLGLPSSKTYTFASAAVAYAREISRRWAGQCQSDITIVYIQSWQQPDNFRKPFIVRLFQNKFAEFSSQPFVQSFTRDTSPFEIISSLFSETLRLVSTPPSHQHQQHSSSQKHNPRQIRQKIEKTNSFSNYFESWGSVGGVPLWALALGSGLLLLVVIAIYVMTFVTERLAVQKQILKKQSINVSRYNNERWRAASSHYNALPGTSSATGQRIVKSTMPMFRQFSGDRKSKGVAAGNKI
uniref:Uncharacterized protein n=1 Tax=Panagrolaimus sp. ES5 TaxID=591445 RepID=A0AC34FEQ3_9BILA